MERIIGMLKNWYWEIYEHIGNMLWQFDKWNRKFLEVNYDNIITANVSRVHQ